MAMYYGDKSGRAVKFVPGAKLSAQELLDKLKTVDGEGSGLDADTLDGKQASEFVQLDENNKVPEENIPFVTGKTSNQFLHYTIPSRSSQNGRNMFAEVAYGNGIYLMLTRDGFSAISKDTLNWSYSSVPVFFPDKSHGPICNKLVFFKGFFYFFGNFEAERELGDSQHPHFIYKSSDGLKWERYQMGVSGMNGFRYNAPIQSICYENGRFLGAVGGMSYTMGTEAGLPPEFFFGNTVIFASDDMVNWEIVKNETNIPYNSGQQLGEIIWDNGEYIVFLLDNSIISCLVSSDGKNFTHRSTIDRPKDMIADSFMNLKLNDNGVLIGSVSGSDNQNGLNGREHVYLLSRDRGNTIELKTVNLKSFNINLKEKNGVFYLFNFPTNSFGYLHRASYWSELLTSADGENWERKKLLFDFTSNLISLVNDYFFILSSSYREIIISKEFKKELNSGYLLDTQYIKFSTTFGQCTYNDSGFALQKSTMAERNQLVCGKGNVPKYGPGGSGKSGDIFIIGNGEEDKTVRSNAFRVAASGDVFAAGEYSTTGADYAEFFEWEDGNPNNEDRRGRVVTLDGEKIRYAADGEYILGIISGAPAVLGDTYDDQWAGMYEKDIFGAPIKEYYSEDIYDEYGDFVETVEGFKYKLNPNYDPTQPYIPRADRKEWAMVGMLGKLTAQDDGTCQVNGFAQVHQDGVFTKSAAETRFRVMSRIDATHVRVLVR